MAQPRRPRTRHDEIRDQLAAAATTLRAAGEHESAATVDLARLYGGWSDVPPTGALAQNMTLLFPTQDDRDRIVAMAKQVGRNVSQDVNEALAAFVARSFTPARQVRTRSHPGTRRPVMTVTVSADLAAQAKEAAHARADELGFTPTLPHIAAAYLTAKYPAPDTTPAE